MVECGEMAEQLGPELAHPMGECEMGLKRGPSVADEVDRYAGKVHVSWD